MMKTYFKRPTTGVFTILASFILIFLTGSCEPEQMSENQLSPVDARANVKNDKSDAEMEEEDFPTYHQGFNHGTSPWADNSIDGFWGWCGSIDLMDHKSGDVKPSAGRGYATVMFGDCNEYWVENFGPVSGPATFDDSLWSDFWPDSGFIHELDIYLDPDHYSFENGNAFVYANSLYYEALAYPFIYFAVSVDMEDGHLYVNDHLVENEGWYTFRQVYNMTGEGALMVNFELIDHGKPVYSTSIDHTLEGEETHSYIAEKLGSGYIWFPNIAEGVALPIDEYRLRPGK